MSRLLIIEDNPDIAILFGAIFAEQETTVVSDVPPALNFLNRFRPDLVITDFMLPNGTGVDIISHVRRNKYLYDVPILGVSVDDTQRDELIERGADAFMTKPIDIEALMTMAQRLIMEPPERSAYSTLDPQQVLANYIQAYEAVYHRRPECYWTGRHFLIDKQRCDQNWMQSETTRLQNLLNKPATPRSTLMRLIDKLRRI
jgi:DNA-binding response OmpR family regulator